MTWQPAGICGSAKRTSARALPRRTCESTLSTESLPKLLVGALCSTQASAFAAAVTVEAVQVGVGGASIVQK